ncbi:MAG: tetratricopeptide repeat protein [Rhodanobacteraceae bacterium]
MSDWNRIKDLFLRSQEVSTEERAAWVANACGEDMRLRDEVEALLQAQREPATILDGDAGCLVSDLLGTDVADDDSTGDRIGPWRLLRLLGEGGMGRVYLAERVEGDFGQRVALKRIRAEFAGTAQRQRFLREREILARLAHANITQLHEGGLDAAGMPYFTLEYVEGESITRYCDAHRLDVRARIRQLLQICSALAYAHRHLVIHRDLKPSNILVTVDGEVKLLDFGIAKLLEDAPGTGLTEAHGRVMTREYAAPEQVLGDPVSTATDVYSFGVLAYELLTGHLPYPQAEGKLVSFAKAIVEQAPEPMSQALVRAAASDRANATPEAIAGRRDATPQSLRRLLRGDLERILLRALAKSPEARYPTIGALADDLNAWLDGKPIRGGSRTQRMRKFVRRHWLPMSTAATALLAIVLGAGIVAWEARQREAAAERALQEAKTTAAVKDFLFGVFTAVDPREAKGRDVTARELLERGARRVDRNFDTQPALKAELKSVLGRIYYQLGQYAEASALQATAIGALGKFDRPLLLTQTEIDRANTLRALGDLKSATVLADEAIARLDALSPTASRAQIKSGALHVRGAIAMDARDFVAAERYAVADLALTKRSNLDAETRYQAATLAGGASWGLDRLDEAETHYRDALDMALHATDDLDVARARSNIAMVLQTRSRYIEAENQTRQALVIYRRVLGADHADTLGNQRALALAEFHLGHYVEARKLLEEVLAAQRKALGDRHPAIAGTLINLGLVLADSGDLDAAERSFSEARQIWETKYGHDYAGTLMAIGNLGYLHGLRGDLPAAERELAEVRAADMKRDTEDVVDDYRLGEIRRLRGDPAGAARLDRKALETARKLYGENTRFAAVAHHCLGLALRDSGDAMGAERELRASLASFAGYIAHAEHPLAATTRLDLASLLATRSSDRKESLQLATEAVEIRERFLGPADSRTHAAREALAKLRADPQRPSPEIRRVD